MISSAPSLPISGFIGEPRVSIVDEDGKIDLNSVASSSSQGVGNPLSGGNSTGANTASTDPTLFWKNALRELLNSQGFQREQYDSEEFRTRGNVGLSAADMVATIQDWADADTEAYSSASFDGSGIESGANKSWFYNRPFKTLSELLLVPGMTLERMVRIAPYVKVSSRSTGRGSQVNVNTAPYEVLVAAGATESEAIESIQQRLDLPIRDQDRQLLFAGNQQLLASTKTTSNEFSVLSRVDMPATTRWLRAYVTVSGGASRRRSAVLRYELY